MVVEQVIVGRQHIVDPMSQLVGQGHDVTRIARVVHEHVRVVIGCHGGAVGAPPFALTQSGVDPLVGEESVRRLCQLGAEIPERVEHHLAGLRKRDVGLLTTHGGVAIVVGQVVDAEDPSLQPVVPRHGVEVGGADIRDGVDDGAVQLIGQVPAGFRLIVGAQAVEDVLLV